MLMPKVQTYAAQKVVQYVNKNYGTSIQIASLRYQFPNYLELQDILIPDHLGDTLIAAQKIALYYNGQNPLNNTIMSAGIALHKPVFRVRTYPGDSVTTIAHFINHFGRDTTPAEEPFRLRVEQLQIHDGEFQLEDKNCKGCFKMWLHSINGDFSDFILNDEFVTITAHNLKAQDDYHIKIDSLTGKIGYQPQTIYWHDAYLKTPRSEVKGSMVLRYDSLGVFDNFENEVRLEGSFSNSTIHSSDIAPFASAIPPFNAARLSGRVTGTVNNMSLKQMHLEWKANTILNGNLNLKNAAATEELYGVADSLNIYSSAYEINALQQIFTDSGYTLAPQIGKIHLQGNFKGTPYSFTTALELKTAIGNVKTSGTIKNIRDAQRCTYQLSVLTDNLMLEHFLPKGEISDLSSRLKVEGSGYELAQMQMKVKGSVPQFTFRQKKYQNFDIEGSIAQGQFVGNFELNDPDTYIEFSGNASFKSKPYQYDLNATVQNLNLYHLGVLPDTQAVLSTNVRIEARAFNINHWVGSVVVDSLYFTNRFKHRKIGRVSLTSRDLDSNKLLQLRSPIANANIRGAFTWQGIAQVFKNQVYKYMPQKSSSNPNPTDQFTFDLTLKKPRLLSEIIEPQLVIADNSYLMGNYDPQRHEFKLELQSNHLEYEEYLADSVDLQYSGGLENSFVNMSIPVLKLPGNVEIDSLFLGNFFYRDTLQYILRGVVQDSINSRFNLEGYALQKSANRFTLSMDGSTLNFGPLPLRVPKGSRLTLDTNGLLIEDLWFENDTATMTINGYVNDDPNQILRVELHRFSMDFLNYILRREDMQFKGQVGGYAILNQLTSNEPKMAGDLDFKNLQFNQKAVGDMQLQATWFPTTGEIQLGAQSYLGQLKLLDMQGSYYPRRNDSIAFGIVLDNFRVAALTPFAAGLVSNLRGFLDADLLLAGTLSNPALTGTATLPKTGFTIPMLNTDYNLTQSPTLRLNPGELVIKNMKLRDTKYKTAAELNGTIGHQYFRDLKINLNINSEKFLVLNTTYKPNDLYYGTAFVGGAIGITGNLDKVTITSDVETKGQSNFNLPLSGATEVKRSKFFEFVNPLAVPDTASKDELPTQTDIALDFDIKINEQTKLSVILDAQTGNKLNASGQGSIKLKMDALGNIELFGNYQVIKGEYDFNLEGYFNRKFKVLRGGSVSWNGDPYEANLDLQAQYTTRADPSIIIPNYNGGTTLTEVLLNITGSLSQPEIGFDINTPRISSSYQTVLDGRLSDANSRNQQVFSLLALNSFTPGSSSAASGSQGGLINQWDILADQASSWLNKLTGDYEITLNYQQGTPANNTQGAIAQEELEVGVSKSLFDNRISINGMVGVPLNSNANAVAGDFEIRYDITRDGKIQAKAFSRSIQNDFNFSSSQIYRHGVGLSYQIDFSSYGELVKRIFNAKQKAIREEEDEEEGDGEE